MKRNDDFYGFEDLIINLSFAYRVILLIISYLSYIQNNYMLENELNTISFYNYNILVKFGASVFLWHFSFATKAPKHKITLNLKEKIHV